MKHLFVVNPVAGKQKPEEKLRLINEAIDRLPAEQRSRDEFEIYVTEAPMDACRHIRGTAADGAELRVYACGGDGTLNETITGLMRCPPEGRPPVGYIPAGTVNDFASSLGISKNLHEAAATILSGEPFLCDVGAFGDRYFSYIAAFGAFTDVSYQTPQQSKNLLGRAAYFLEAILRLPAVKAYRMSVTHDGETVEGEFLFGMVTNSRSVGGSHSKLTAVVRT